MTTTSKTLVARIFATSLGILSLTGCETIWGAYLRYDVNVAADCERAVCATGASAGACAYHRQDMEWRSCTPGTDCEGGDITLTRTFMCMSGSDGGASMPDMGPVAPKVGDESTGVRTYDGGTQTLVCAPKAGPIKFLGSSTDIDWPGTPCLWIPANSPQAKMIIRVNLVAGEQQTQYKLDPATVMNSQGNNNPLVMFSSDWYWMNPTDPRDTRVLSNANRASGGMALNFRIFDPLAATDKVCSSAATGGCDLPQ